MHGFVPDDIERAIKRMNGEASGMESRGLFTAASENRKLADWLQELVDRRAKDEAPDFFEDLIALREAVKPLRRQLGIPSEPEAEVIERAAAEIRDLVKRVKELETLGEQEG